MPDWALRVAQPATTTGTGTFTLSASAVSGGYQVIPASLDGSTVQYVAVDTANDNWEVGLGVYTDSGRTLTRATIHDSSNAGSVVNFTVAPTVFLTITPDYHTFVSAPASPSSSGTPGQWAWSSPYAYICVSSDTWIRFVAERTWT